MLGPIDYILWFGSVLLEGYVVVCSLRHREFLRYFTLNFYLLATLAITVLHFYYYRAFGLTSPQYTYAYYWGDSLETILLFFVVMSLYQYVFEELGVTRHIRAASILLLGGTAVISYAIVHEHSDQLATRFVVGLSQNLYFVGVVLSYLLWGAVMKLRETRTRLIQLVLSLGVYFSAYAAVYALRNMMPDLAFLKLIPPIVGTWLPLSWAYTFTKVPEEARLATARVATPHR